MPTTDDATLQLIQQEISEVVQREKELRASYARSESENGIITSNGSDANETSKPPLDRTKSTPAFTNGHSSSANAGRLFTQNPTTKGVMQRFIKSRGKLSTMSTTTNKSQPVPNSWTNQDFIESPKPMVPAGMQPRNGFVPVEERIRKEIQETQKRESELRIERQKSQPDLLALLEPHSPEPERSLRSARSVSQLSDFDSYEESASAPPSLKAARSLAELCDVDEEAQPPGSLTLIKQWENIIQKNQQARS